jgi:antitoxin ParD1/3/4
MNITLTPELENLINEKIKSGKYDSPGEVIREGLRLLKEQDELKRIRLEELRREVQKGIDEMREGRFTTYNSTEELAEEIIKEARAEYEARKNNGK